MTPAKTEGFCIWLTGLQGAGKTTIAGHVEKHLRGLGLRVETLDGDEVRAALSPKLGFTAEARDENTKRIAYVAKLLARNGVAVLCPVVAPERRHRDRCREWVDRFVEVYVKASMPVLEERDPKGLYAKAKRGEVDDLVGVHQPYEEPLKPEVVVDTDAEPPEASARRVIRHLERAGYVPATLGDDDEHEYARDDEETVRKRLEALGYL